MAEIGDREPFGSREGAVIAAIAAAFAPADATHAMNSRQTSASGVCLSGWLTNRIAVKAAMKALPMTTYMVLWRRYAHGDSQIATAKHFHLPLNVVRNAEVEGLQELVRMFWSEPGYVSPPRTRRPNPLREWLESVLGQKMPA